MQINMDAPSWYIEVLIELDSIDQVKRDINEMCRKFGLGDASITATKTSYDTVDLTARRQACRQPPTDDLNLYTVEINHNREIFFLYGAIMYCIGSTHTGYEVQAADFYTSHVLGTLRDGFSLYQGSPIQEFIEDD